MNLKETRIVNDFSHVTAENKRKEWKIKSALDTQTKLSEIFMLIQNEKTRRFIELSDVLSDSVVQELKQRGFKIDLRFERFNANITSISW